jgi:ribosomal protein S27E
MPTAVLAQPPADKEIYQDFRGKRPLLSSFELVGPDLDAVVKPEEGGLRITLPGTWNTNRFVEVAATFVLSGDFEVTGTYELLTTEKPVKPYGVSLNVGNNPAKERVAWVGRWMRPNNGSVFHSECWDKPNKFFQTRSKPTQATTGQLRIVRVGPKVTCLASEGPGKEFSKINEMEKFGADDVQRLRFQVVTGISTGHAVDVRLVDLRVRYGPVAIDKSAAPAPLAPPAPVSVVEPDRKPARTGWLAIMLMLGLAITLLVAGVIALLLVMQRRRAPVAANQAALAQTNGTLIPVQCSGCGRGLMAKAELAGKKVKCTQCGKAVAVPSEDTPEA